MFHSLDYSCQITQDSVKLKENIMDMKGKMEEIVAKIKSDPGFAAKFKSDPVKAVESIVGIDLPEDQIKPLIDGVKAKITTDQAGSLLGNINKLF
jgi:hypothetical protein